MANNDIVICDADEYVRNLPIIPTTQLPAHEVDRQCPVCLVKYGTTALPTEPTEDALRLPCGHVIGSRCLRHWLATTLTPSGSGANCPVCRHQLGEDAQHWLRVERRSMRVQKDFALYRELVNRDEITLPPNHNGILSPPLNWRQERALFVALQRISGAFRDHDSAVSGKSDLDLYEEMRDASAHYCLACQTFYGK